MQQEVLTDGRKPVSGTDKSKSIRSVIRKVVSYPLRQKEPGLKRRLSQMEITLLAAEAKL
jgi:hypothetical protein